jgi:hypothetical protein
LKIYANLIQSLSHHPCEILHASSQASNSKTSNFDTGATAPNSKAMLEGMCDNERPLKAHAESRQIPEKQMKKKSTPDSRAQMFSPSQKTAENDSIVDDEKNK